jgi:putative DNA methylase
VTSKSNDRRLIEVNIPLTEISAQSSREKSIRHGHISTLHIWWARRPLAACRAAIFATLMDAPETEAEREKLEALIATIVDWDHVKDGNSAKIEEAKALIREQFDGRAPRVLDPFAGGGAIPLEAQRLGCEAHALDLNPVAHLIELCTLVYPQKYADGVPGPETETQPCEGLKPSQGSQGSQLPMAGLEQPANERTLAGDVERWGHWVLEQARAEIGQFYENPAGDDTIVAYLWARTVQCPNPACGATIPLVKQFWLRRKRGKTKVALKPVVDYEGKQVSFKVVRGDEIDFDPSKGTSSRGSATCPVCNQVADVKYVRAEGQAGRMGQMPLAVITTSGYGEGKQYRSFTPQDMAQFEAAQAKLEELEAEHEGRWSLVPDEPLPLMSGAFNVPLYGLDTWGKLFNDRQAISLVTFTCKVQAVYEGILHETSNAEYAQAVTTYLALALDRLASYNSTLCYWVFSAECLGQTFAQGNSLPMKWDYAEVNPLSDSTGDYLGALNWILGVIEHCSQVNGQSTVVKHGNATRVSYPDNYFDSVITDPPYYNAVPYADLSDFFYVWLKRSLGHLYPDILRSPLTPKSAEIVEMKSWDSIRYGHKDEGFYQKEMTRAFREIHRILKLEGRCAVMFAHKTTSAWETLIAGLLAAGLVTTASWPLHTERSGRLRAYGSAALASSILLICKKRDPEASVGYYDDVRRQLEERIQERLDFFFWEQNIRGSDFFISAIGPALEVFGRYAEVRRLSGERVTVGEFLIHVREIVTDYALAQVLRDGGVGAVDPATRFYVLWRWAYSSNQVPFDDGRVLAQALGAEIDDLMHKTDLLAGRANLKLRGPKDRSRHEEDLGEPQGGIPAPLIDVVQRACVLWGQGERVALSEFLNRALAGREETFWNVAQSLSEILPEGDKEKQLLHGMLVSQDRLPDASRQERLL